MIAQRQESEMKDREMLARLMENFMRRWKPEEEREVRDFEIEFLSLVNHIQACAQAPMIRHMSMALAIVPSPFIIPTKEMGK